MSAITRNFNKLILHKYKCGVALFILVLSVMSGLSAWSSRQSAPHMVTHWLHIVPQPLENQLGLVGRIQAATQVAITAPFDGVLQQVNVHEGQYVEKNQILLTLDTSQLEIQLRQAQAELMKAQRETQQLQNWAHSTEVSRARRAVSTAQQTLKNSLNSLRDTQSLFKRGIVARMEVDALTQQVEVQQQDLIAAQDELMTTLAHSQGLERQIADIELTNARARYDTLQAAFSRKEVKAPVAGYIVSPIIPEHSRPLLIQSGMPVNVGTPLIDIINQDTFRILTRVEEIDLHLLREGMPVQITGDGFAGLELTGHIAAIGMQGNVGDSQQAGAKFDVTIDVDSSSIQPAQRVRIGMSAQLMVVLYRNEQGIAVPPAALHRDDSGNTYVIYRQTANSPPQKVEVTPGQAFVQGIEIHGITSGQVNISGDGLQE
ncbi:efflux RND transporter periplasmic adaptor subunit [Yersinia enterocolitica]